MVKIVWAYAWVMFIAAFLSVLEHSGWSASGLRDQFGMMIALFHAGAINMFDNFAFKQAQIDWARELFER